MCRFISGRYILNRRGKDKTGMINKMNTACLGCLIPLFIVFLVFSGLGTSPANAAVRTVTVGVYEDPPKIFTSESGKPSGIFIDIIKQIAKLEDWNLNFVHGTWAEGLDRLAKREIDLMPDVAYTADREEIYSFHKVPVLSVWSQVYAPKNSGIQSILDLNGKRVAALEQTIQLETFKRLTNSFGLKITLIPVPDYKTEFEMIVSRKADAGLTNRFYGLMYARKFGLEDTPVMFDPAPFFFAAQKGDPKKLLDKIDSRLYDLKKDPQSAYYASMRRWTSEEVQLKLPSWMKMTGLVLGVILLMSLAGSVILKHQVDLRTGELKQINQEMEQRIAERTTELTAANDKLKELDKLKSMFIASMSHELRTPLNSIIGFTGMTLQGLSGELADEQKDNLSRVYHSAKHLLSLITDIIDISKIEAGRIDAYPEAVFLEEITDEAVDTVMPQVKEKGLVISVDVPVGIRLNIDRKRLLQSLLNFMSNAVKFTESGKITVSAREKDGKVYLSVSDTGIGIPEKELPRLFEAFERLDTHLRVKAGGTGLGLYLTKKLATDVLHGDISVQSRVGQGSTFTIIVPTDVSLPGTA